jgi:hypothetical protein
MFFKDIMEYHKSMMFTNIFNQFYHFLLNSIKPFEKWRIDLVEVSHHPKEK